MKGNKPIKHPEGRGAWSTLKRRITEKASKIHYVIFHHPREQQRGNLTLSQDNSSWR